MTYFIKDLLAVTASLLIALWMVGSPGLDKALSGSAPENAYVGAIVAGFFFTSVFTTAPAIILLGKLAEYSGAPFAVAFFGAVGALIGDLIIFRFIHNRLRTDVYALAGRKLTDKLRHIFRKKIYHRFAPLMAGLIIASPLPDELGLALVGFDGSRVRSFELFSFLANFAGILVISYIAISG